MAIKVKNPLFKDNSPFTFERTLKVTDWDSTLKTQSVPLAEIEDDSLVTWNLVKDCTTEEYESACNSELSGVAEVGALNFTVTDLPEIDLRVLIVVERVRSEEGGTVSEWKSYSAYSHAEWMHGSCNVNIDDSELEAKIIGKTVKELMGDSPHLDYVRTMSFNDGSWVLPVTFGISMHTGNGYIRATGSDPMQDPTEQPISQIVYCWSTAELEEGFQLFNSRGINQFITNAHDYNYE